MINLKVFRPLLEVLAVSAPLFLLHQLAFFLFGINEQLFVLPLWFAYVFFIGFSLVTMLILVFVKQKSFDNVGMVFLICSMVQMFVAFLVFHPILKSKSTLASFEKYNFLVVFGLFLMLETIIVIRMLKTK